MSVYLYSQVQTRLCIISAADQKVISKFNIKNDKASFEQLLISLNSLSDPDSIKIRSESTAHYGNNLVFFLVSKNFHVCMINIPSAKKQNPQNQNGQDRYFGNC